MRSSRLRTNSLFSLLFFLNAISIAHSQSLFTHEEQLELESLLLFQRIEEAENFKISHNAVLDSAKIDSLQWVMIRKEDQRYNNLFHQLRSDDLGLDSTSHFNIIKNAYLVKNRFDPVTAGSLANSAYNAFLHSLSDDAPDLKFYIIANFLRTNFFYREQARLHRLLASVRKLIRLGQYEDADRQLNQMLLQETNNPALFELRDTIPQLQRAIQEQLADTRQKQRTYLQTEEFYKPWGTWVGFGLLSIDDIKKARWEFFFDDLIAIRNITDSTATINGSVGTAFYVEQCFYFTSSLAVDLKFTRGSVTFSRVILENIPYNAKFSHSYTMWSANVRYFFRKELGLRPYFRIGFGFETVLRKQLFRPINLELVPGYNFSYKYSSREITASFEKVIIGLGCDYVFSNESPLVVGVFLDLQYNVKSTSVTSVNSLFSGLKAGIVF